MTTLIVTAHPDTGSLTHLAAARMQQLLGPGDLSFAHLAQEGFDPRFTAVDRSHYAARGEPDSAVTEEQERLDGVDHLVLVFPVYWWSMPALLKGWIDRVFVAGWAFGFDDEERLVPRLGHITAHLLPVSGTSADSFARHGYLESMRAQIESGIIAFCGMQPGVTAFVHDSETIAREEMPQAVDRAAAEIVAAIARPLQNRG